MPNDKLQNAKFSNCCICFVLFLKVARAGSEPGIFWFRLFSHSVTLPLSHSGSPAVALFYRSTICHCIKIRHFIIWNFIIWHFIARHFIIRHLIVRQFGILPIDIRQKKRSTVLAINSLKFFHKKFGMYFWKLQIYRYIYIHAYNADIVAG
jgi:hypothetical protein